MKTAIHDSDCGYLAYEVHPELGLVIHCEIHKWSKEAYKEYKEYWQIIIDDLRGKVPALYAAIPAWDKKNEKFAKMFGFEKTDQIFKNGDVEFSVFKLTTE